MFEVCLFFPAQPVNEKANSSAASNAFDLLFFFISINSQFSYQFTKLYYSIIKTFTCPIVLFDY